MAHVYMLVGTVGTGKTTFAKQKEKEWKAILFSCDEWMIHLFGSDLDREAFEKKLALCQELIFQTALKVLDRGVNVIFDFGFWKRRDRDALRESFKDHTISLIYMKIPEDEIKRRLQYRNEHLPPHAYRITEDMFALFSGWFEPPEEDENPILVITS